MVSLLNAPKMSKKISKKTINNIAPLEEANNFNINFFEETNLSVIDETFTYNSDILKPNIIIASNWINIVESNIGQINHKKKSLSIFPILFALTNLTNTVTESNSIELNTKSSR